jgi:hypothetical protein
MTAQMIRRFQIEGEAKDENLEHKKDEWRRTLVIMMKDDGFVPLFDVNPVFTWHWVKDELFKFSYTWQGVYVGKGEVWQIEGVSDGKRIPSTPRHK